ncbi:helix-turn-helix transcriptional regulator [Chloroflexota bacterium]
MVKYRVLINPRNKWADDAREAKVSTRGLEVLALVADGADNILISQMLDIKYQTVKNHLHNVVKKLGASNVTEAFMVALAKGLLIVTEEEAKPLEKWSGIGHGMRVNKSEEKHE